MRADHEGFGIGPLISRHHRDKVTGCSTRCDKRASSSLAGVFRTSATRDAGAFITTSAVGLTDDATFVRKEAFGPVIHVSPFDDEAEVVARANDTRYGLATSIWTENLSRAYRVAPQIQVGHAWINSWQLRDLLSRLAVQASVALAYKADNMALILLAATAVTTRLFGAEA